MTDAERLRELLVRADSYLSLLWHRHTRQEARDDVDLQVNVNRTIGDLRRTAAALEAQAQPAEGRSIPREGLDDVIAQAERWLQEMDAPPRENTFGGRVVVQKLIAALRAPTESRPSASDGEGGR